MTPSDSLLDVARRLASEAGDLIREGRASAQVAATKSSSVDIVTQMDLASERLLRDRLAQWRPGDGILGEEGDDVESETGITWVLDPIDGTVNYLYGIPHYGVSVAAVSGEPTTHGWTLEAGAISDATGVLWSAARGQGAFRDGESLTRAGDAPPLERTLLATGFQYLAERREAQGRVAAAMVSRVRDIRRLGAGAIDLCHVAAGTVDAYYEHGLQPWDIAAGALIAREAGLMVAGIDGGPADESVLIAAAPERWHELRDALVEAGAAHLWDAAGR
ncbi:inositol monophosphatase family protein [Demequina sp. NBRC 110057]|uniref:inositol monophosphatase family protein n=1 Tax=Demequina sp. NBRC 110057 TaxID=1570346 RepID=UPI000A02ADFC|nr:inositol monophosphatase family protein [Demequina sp. NBRC 110057]